jgi:hypothetical protein
MARRAGVIHGFYAWVLGAVLLFGAVAILDDVARDAAVVGSFDLLGIPTDFDHWRDLPTVVGLAWGAVMLAGACVGGGLGERWHTRLVARAADPAVGPNASPPAASAKRERRFRRERSDRGMVDVGDRIGGPVDESSASVEDREREPSRSV